MTFATQDGEGNPTPDNGIKGDDKDVVRIPLDDDADDEPEQAAAPRPERDSSSRNRGGKMRELQQTVERLTKDYTGLQSNLQRMIEEATRPLAEQLSKYQTQPAAQQQADAPDPQKMTDRMNEILNEYQTEGLTPANRQKLTVEYNRLAGELQKARDRQIEERVRTELKKEFGQDRNTTQAQRILDTLEDEYPELWHNVSQQEANARLGKIRAYVEHQAEFEGRPRSAALYKEAAAHLRAKLNLGPTPEPTRDRGALAAPVGGRRGPTRPDSLEVPVRMMNGMANATGLDPSTLAKFIKKSGDQ